MALDNECKDQLWGTLIELSQVNFKVFRFHAHLPESVDENADQMDIVNELEKKHGKDAVEETVKILETINEYHLAEKLRKGVLRIKDSARGKSTTRRRKACDLRRTSTIFSVDNDRIAKFKWELQNDLRSAYINAPEGNTEPWEQPCLADIYTDLNITHGADISPTPEHEVLQMEMCGVAKKSIEPCNIFKSASGKPQPIRLLLTVGFAGIGKTFLVRKFVLDWASRKTNKDVDFIFPFTFRELNLENGKSFSLANLIRYSIPETKVVSVEMLNIIFVRLQGSGKHNYESSNIKILFVLDGLDECRLKLDLSNKTKKDLDVTKAYPVEVLLANLITKNLLPCARIWITTRPMTAHNIPPNLINSKTEVKGFSDSQRLDYFRKRFRDEEYIVKHIQKSRTLFIMCHMPIFCWLTTKVLQDYLDKGKYSELPKTLTEMYTAFLFYHLDKSKERLTTKSIKYVKALAKLAFDQLMKKSQLFYENDLRDSGFDYLRAAKHSGVFTEVIKKVHPLKKNQQVKMFQFIHLTMQEYLAALYVMMSFFHDNKNVLAHSALSLECLVMLCKQKPITQVHDIAIQRAAKSDGNLDLFLRFLLGLSLQCNQDILGELLKVPKHNEYNKSDTVLLIKKRIEQNTPGKNINLFYCLNELKDNSLLEQIQRYLRSGRLSSNIEALDMWSALVFFLLSSDEAMNCFDFKQYCASAVGLLMLLPVVKASQKSLLNDCNLSKDSYHLLTSVLSSPSNLRHLDLSDNDLYDSGAEILSDGLAKPHCILQVLRLSGCMITTPGCVSLAKALELNPSHLEVLDLSYNYPGEEGKRILMEAQMNPSSSLKTVNLDHGGKERLISGLKKYLCRPTLDPNTAHDCLQLSDRCKTVTVVLEEQLYPRNPQRFTCWRQILCKDGLSGRRYWEVDLEGKVSVGATYDTIRRIGEGDDVCLGGAEASWALLCDDNATYAARHHDRTVNLEPRASPESNKVAVFLDHPGGALSFYKVTSEGMILLHAYHATFTQPLYPAFGFGFDNGFDGVGDSVSIGGENVLIFTRF
ncbi:NACHT, LRR and PYD domains-containing protein 3-like isoform X2 [Phycodurus eques]|uniref:NACHT, LRR and PYD domains-containing protein 3-like isoform X2 n=1 Tax=Phycodurus eques TaxID=693459 RepID=UPI002ACE5F89|nr:NACHT, LRR and PYD domains-containing protein 3-like isoform X2 [Phycodurus eques]